MAVVGAAAAASEDDLVDAALAGVGLVVFASLFAASAAVGAAAVWSMSPASAGERRARLALNDAANTSLAGARVCLCWARYSLYDAQVDLVDMALQYTDELFVDWALRPGTPAWAAVDVSFFVSQLALSLFKLAIATFLLWLIIDLFVLRPVARVAAAWRLRS